MDFKKKVALGALRGAGTINLKRMIKSGKVKKDEPVDLAREVASMKATINASPKSAYGMAAIGITDADLEGVIRDMCKKCGLQVK